MTKSFMRSCLLVSAASVVTTLVASCTDNQDAEGARALLARARSADYRTWTRAPGYATRQPSLAPHGGNVEVFVNDIVTQALAEPRLYAWPVGSIVAKDGYDDDGDLHIIALMERREAGWFFAEYDDGGDPLFSGQPDICTGCHRLGDDFVRAFYFPPGNVP